LPIAAPAPGVVTQMKVNLATSTPGVELKVLEPGGYPNDFHVVSETPLMTTVPGQNVFETRIPVKAGYRFGIYGPEGTTPYCHTAYAQDTMGLALGDLQVGSTASFTMETQALVPIAATIEPDADGDSFGDETQDACPTDATT